MGKQSGFTIVEIIIVIAVLGIMAAIGVPNFLNWLPKYRLQSAARDLYSNLYLAKISAIKNNTSWAIVFNVDANTYQVCSGKGPDNSWGGPNIVVKTVILSDYGSNVTYGKGSAAKPVATTFGNWVTYSSPRDVAVLNSRGMSNSGYVYLTNSTNTSCIAVGTSFSGIVRLVEWPW